MPTTGAAVRPAVRKAVSLMMAVGSSRAITSTYFGAEAGKKAAKVEIVLSRA